MRTVIVIMMAITPSLNASSLAVVITHTVPGNQRAWPQLRMKAKLLWKVSCRYSRYSPYDLLATGADVTLLHKDIGCLSHKVAEEVGAISATKSGVVRAYDHSVVGRIANEPSG